MLDVMSAYKGNPSRPQMRTLALSTLSGARPLLRLGLLAGLACLANAVLAGSYTPPTPPPSPAPGRYPVGYDPDNRARPPAAFPASSILLSKPMYPPASPLDYLTRGEAKAARWSPPLGYDPAVRPPLRRTDFPNTLPEACPAPDCDLDPSIHICTGIWMGRTIIDRRCLKLDSDGLRGGGTHQASTDIL